MYRMYQDYLSLQPPGDLQAGSFDKLIIVDTRSWKQIQEYFDSESQLPETVIVYDHHGFEPCDIPKAVHIAGNFGANTSLIADLLIKQNIKIRPEDATLALAGIVADTGSFSHANVSSGDFAAATWLMNQGADLVMVRKLTNTLFDAELERILHNLLGTLQTREINGRRIIVSEMKLSKQTAGLSLLVEKIADFEEADAIFCVFQMEKEHSHLIVARSSRTDLDVAWLLSFFGGGGHPQAAAALVKKSGDVPVMKLLEQILYTRMEPADCADILMEKPSRYIYPNWTILEASMHLEQCNISALPVCDEQDNLKGIFSLSDIQKARKAQNMQAPVSAYMTYCVKTLETGTPFRLLESSFMQTDHSMLPLVKDSKVLGIVTRKALLNYLRGKPAKTL